MGRRGKGKMNNGKRRKEKREQYVERGRAGEGGRRFCSIKELRIVGKVEKCSIKDLFPFSQFQKCPLYKIIIKFI